MFIDNYVIRDAETQTRAFADVLGRKKGIEHFGNDVRRDSGSVIRNFTVDIFTFFVCPD